MRAKLSPCQFSIGPHLLDLRHRPQASRMRQNQLPAAAAPL
jgi:hypothetical protein